MVMSTLPSPSVSNWKRSALPSPSVSVAHRSALPSLLVSPTIRSWRSSPRVSTVSSLMPTPHVGWIPRSTVSPASSTGERGQGTAPDRWRGAGASGGQRGHPYLLRLGQVDQGHPDVTGGEAGRGAGTAHRTRVEVHP